MEDLEITTLPVADRRDLPKLRTLGYDDEGNAAQVHLSDLLPQQIQAASIDFMNGLYIARSLSFLAHLRFMSTASATPSARTTRSWSTTMPPMASNSPASKAATR